MKRKLNLIPVLLFALLFLPGCGGGGGGGDDDGGGGGGAAVPSISVSGATTLTFSGTEGESNPAEKTFAISNTGETGSTLNWTADVGTSGGGDWLSVSPSSGALSSGQQTTVTVSVDIGALDAGGYSGTITVADPEASNTSPILNISLQVAEPAAPPTINVNYTGYAVPVSENPMTFTAVEGTSPTPQSLTVNNAGEQTLAWTAETEKSWLSMDSTQGSLAGSTATGIQVSVSAAGLAPGDYTGNITITGVGAANSPFTVPVSLTVTQKAAAASGDVFIGGSAGVTQLSSLVAGVGKATTGDEVEKLPNSKVLITIIKPDGSTSKKVVYTDDQGNYSSKITVQEGDRIVVNIEKDGYTRFSKSVRVEPGGQYTVNGFMAKTERIVASKDSAYFKSSGTTAPAFRFGVVRHRDGSRSTFGSASDLQVAKAAGGTADLEVTIPAAKVDPEVETLTAQLAGFDPNNSAERKMFPGEFVGTGGWIASAATDAGEYSLESIVFLQADVRQDDGQELQVVTNTGPAAAADEPITITKWIPAAGCEATKKYQDRDSSREGIQVPIYTYNPETGKWGYLGEGTLMQADGFGGYATVPAQTGFEDLSYLECGSSEYHVEIEVDTDWYSFWNLDYPLFYEMPQTTCIEGSVVNDSGDPLPGVLVWATGPTYFDAYTNQSGNFQLEVVLSDPAELDEYSFWAHNHMMRQDVAFEIGAQGTSCYAPVVTLTDPYRCQVEGTVLDSDMPLEGELIYAHAPQGLFSSWDSTDANGEFSFRTSCGKEIVVQARNQQRKVTVDGVQGTDEQQDLDNVVTVTDISVLNNPPEITIEIWPAMAKEGDRVSLYAWAWDYEGDEPLTYDWQVTGPQNEAVSVENGTVYNATLPTTGLAEGDYAIQVTVTDAKGNSDTRDGVVTVSADNRNPVILDVFTDMTTGTACDPAFHFTVDAYDSDGNYPLTYTWHFPDGTQFTGEESDWLTPVSGEVTLTVADDLGGTATRVFTVSVENRPPEIWWSFAEPVPGLIDEIVFLDAYAWDEENGGSLDYAWSVTDPSGAEVPLSDWSWIPATAGKYRAQLTVSDACGETDTVSFDVSVSDGTGDTTIIIQ